MVSKIRRGLKIRRSITTKILIIVVVTSILAAGLNLFLVNFRLTKVIDSSQYSVYSEKINPILALLAGKAKRLAATGLSENYKDAFQNSVIQVLRQVYYKAADQWGYPFIVDGDGAVLMHPVLAQGPPPPWSAAYVAEILRIKNGDFNYTDAAGVQKWVIFRHFPEWNWFVGYAVPLDVKYAGVRRLRNSIALITAVIALLTIVVLSLIIGRIARPVKSLTAASRAMADGDLEYPIDVKSEDEIGVLAGAFSAMRRVIHEKISALANSEERFRILFNNISNAVFLHDSKGRILDVNNTMTELFSVSREEIIGMDILNHFSGPGNPVDTLADIWKRIMAGESATLEWNARKPHSGECFPVDVRLKSVTFDGEVLVLATIRDLTAQKKAEEQLLKEKSFTEAILDTLPGILYVCDDGGRLVRWNNSFAEQTGLSREKILRVFPADWFAEKDKPVIVQALRDVKEGEVSVEAEIQYQSGPVPYHLTVRMISMDERNYTIWVGLDLTERRKLEAGLVQAQKMEAIGTLAGGIAHDFNNILFAIIGYAELAQSDMEDRQRLENDLDGILKGAVRARDLVRQILTFSRKSVQEKQPLQMSLIVKEALKLLRSSLPTTIAIKQNIVSDAYVLADPTQIHQIVMNLCTNAYHAMLESGGILGVALKEVEFSTVSYVPGLELPPGRYLRLEVSDTGIGMDEATKTKIFEPYFTTREKGEGTGLGLAVVHGIVDSHQGQINIYSEPGKGTTCRIYFPVAAAGNTISGTPQDEKPPAGGSETVMVVDDEEAIVDMIRKALTRYGYKVITFTNAAQALQEFLKQPENYDLVLTDMTMPSLTGAQLAGKIMEIRPELPIILCTGHSDLVNRETALAMGIKEYCEKPMNLNNLAGKVRAALDKVKQDG